MKHAMNCGAAGFDGFDAGECTCGLEWRIKLGTEQEMHAAWRKRAEEAEKELAEVKTAANVLIDYCEAHDWGIMPEPFASINPLLKLLGRVAESAAIPPAPPHNFENTVQPALNALSLESLRDMQVHIADRIKELVQDHGPRVDTKGQGFNSAVIARCPKCASLDKTKKNCVLLDQTGDLSVTRHDSWMSDTCVPCPDPWHAAASQEAESAAPRKDKP